MTLSPSHLRTVEGCSLCPRLCHHVCPAAHGAGSEEGTAWGLMTIVAALEEGALPRSQETAEALYRCTGCGRCTAFCKHGNDVASVLEAAREEAVSGGHAPEAIEVLELEWEGIRSDDEEARAEALRTAHPSDGTTAFLAGSHWLESDASAAQLDRLLRLLAEMADAPVGLLLEGTDGCCGGTATRAGFAALGRQQRAALTQVAAERERLIVECADAAAALGERAIHLTRFLAERSDLLAARCAALPRTTLRLHGGCRERRVIQLAQDELRLLAAVGLEAEPLLDLRGEPECCGGEAIYRAVHPDEAARAGRSLVNRTIGCNPAATSSAQCAAHLQRAGAANTHAVLHWVLARLSGQESP